ncbi:MAG: cadherin-like beta sandwich domain-containing protein [Erysipelothrix sp.]|nr:cadherin-like beta sandwich domain-containing protein [Erysipelothrix sp.]
MKKKIIYLIAIISLVIPTVNKVHAANGISISSNVSTMKIGQTATITVTTDGMHTFSGTASASGAGSGSLQIPGMFAGMSEVFYVKANSYGTITVSVSGNSFKLGTETPSGASATIRITVPEPTTPKPPTTNPKPPTTPKDPVVVKSRDNSLKSITISEGELSPAFDKDVLEYNVLLDPSKTSIEVNAEVNDAKASVSNTGKHDLVVGENLINLVVTPEEGGQAQYKLNVYVEDEPKHTITYDEKDYKIIEHFKGASVPESFEEVELDYNGEKVVGLYSELWKTNLLYLSDAEGHRDFYIYNQGSEGELVYVSKFVLLPIYSEQYLLLEVPVNDQKRLNMTYTDVTIADQTFKGFKYDDPALSSFSIIYVRNMAGEDVYYQYEAGDEAYQLFTDTLAISESEYQALVEAYEGEVKNMWFGMGALGIFIVGLLGIFIAKINKDKKKLNFYKNRSPQAD